jgi:hypothetical protein
MTADQFYLQCVAEVDKVIRDAAVQVGKTWLDRGARTDDLPELMRAFLQELAKLRADALARITARVDRLRQIEAQIECLKATLH